MTTPRKTPAKRSTSKTAAATAPARTTAKRTTRAPARARLATAAGFAGSVEAALGSLPLGPGDAAAAHLARAYAAALDRPRRVAERDEALDRIGPKLLAALGALGGTPTARHRLVGRASTPNPDGEEPRPATPATSTTPGLDELRRVHGRG